MRYVTNDFHGEVMIHLEALFTIESNESFFKVVEVAERAIHAFHLNELGSIKSVLWYNSLNIKSELTLRQPALPEQGGTRKGMWPSRQLNGYTTIDVGFRNFGG